MIHIGTVGREYPMGFAAAIAIAELCGIGEVVHSAALGVATARREAHGDIGPERRKGIRFQQKTIGGTTGGDRVGYLDASEP